MTSVKASSGDVGRMAPCPYGQNRFSTDPMEPTMSLQKIFERSEDAAVVFVVLAFIVTHFGLLYLISAS